ncbi:MAG: DHCW motif cupin fold protein [Ferruginibacter sp.]|nr:DHCW motif cupin fold protein [Ferruginibacter sp.]
MEMNAFPFQVLNWDAIEPTNHNGTTGFATWQAFHMNEIRIRKVQYSAGYEADHWCSKGHIIYCIEGSMLTELTNGAKHLLMAGMSYHVGDNSDAHRSSSENGCLLLIVD